MTTSFNTKQYPTAKEVNDFHRNADTNRDESAIHHTLGNDRAKASPGDHTHDGSDSSSLWSDDGANAVIFNADLTTNAGLQAAVGKLIDAMVMKGAADFTIRS